jgi:hypothetical protein
MHHRLYSRTLTTFHRTLIYVLKTGGAYRFAPEGVEEEKGENGEVGIETVRREESLQEDEDSIAEKERERKKMTKAGATSKPPTSPPTPNDEHIQGNDERHNRRRRERRHCRTAMNTSVDVSLTSPALVPGKHLPLPPTHNSGRCNQRQCRRHRRHSIVDTPVGASPPTSTPGFHEPVIGLALVVSRGNDGGGRM